MQDLDFLVKNGVWNKGVKRRICYFTMNFST